MNRQERENLRDRLQTEIAETLDDMTARRACRRDEPEAWQLPPEPKRKSMNRPDSETQMVDRLMARCERRVNELGETLAKVFGSESARNERRLWAMLTARQAGEAGALRVEIEALREEIAALRGIVADLQGEVAALADDVIDRGGVTTLHKRGTNAA